jgi:exodeoxyribonuclease VII large subunit
MENVTVSVSDAIALINQTLDYAYPSLVIEGEVASFKVNQGKFVFFDIKDDTGTLGCFMMLFQLRMPLEDGMRVRVVASPKVTNWGKFSLTVRDIQPVGEGSLKRAFDLLKAKLDKEGLFAPERKRLLPALPKHIAVISSTQAAGYADFVRILNERWGGVQVDVAHVQVQGFEAPKQIVRAIEYFNQREELPEIIVIIRGGGSADDLGAFNDEFLVRAIAASRVPTVVGVGHEVDESLADLVADVRAATPSHAAQIIVPNKNDIIRAARHDVVRISNIVESVLSELSIRTGRLLEEALRRVEDQLARAGELLVSKRTILSAYDPGAVLARGYALVRGDVSVGGTIEVEQSKRFITAEVKDVRKK